MIKRAKSPFRKKILSTNSDVHTTKLELVTLASRRNAHLGGVRKNGVQFTVVCFYNGSISSAPWFRTFPTAKSTLNHSKASVGSP
ncbi:hypothetical protein PS874_05542 [Pseudomonas fluorescens]|nr:hypothetical protein PS874_05542 [Pseudomonas fluorescens]